MNFPTRVILSALVIVASAGCHHGDPALKSQDDQNTQGGQPGKVSLYGAIASEATGKDAKVILLTEGGKGKSGKKVYVSKSLLASKTNTVSEKDMELLTKNNSTAVYEFGCGKSDLSDVAISTETPLDRSKPLYDIVADTIVVCGDGLSYYPSISSLNANHIILKEANIALTGGVDQYFAIRAKDLAIYGSNLVSIEQKISNPGVQIGASLDVVALKVSYSYLDGISKLMISDRGADYYNPSK